MGRRRGVEEETKGKEEEGVAVRDGAGKENGRERGEERRLKTRKGAREREERLAGRGRSVDGAKGGWK